MRWTFRLVLIFLSQWVIGGMWFYQYGASYSAAAHLHSQLTDITSLKCDNHRQCRAGFVNLLGNIH